MSENKITVKEIVEEILPLLKDTFVAKCQSCGNLITMTFLNGQSVTLEISVNG